MKLPSHRQRYVVGILIACAAVFVWRLVPDLNPSSPLPASSNSPRQLVPNVKPPRADEPPFSIAAVATPAPLPSRGLLIDGKLALTDLPGRLLEPPEIVDLHASEETAPVCPTSGKITTADEEVAVDWDGESHTFFVAKATRWIP